MLNLNVCVGGAKSRRVRNDGGARDSRDGRKSGQKLVEKALPSVNVLITAFGKIDAGDHELVGWNRPVGCESLEQTVNKHTGPGEQDEREGELEHHEQRR